MNRSIRGTIVWAVLAGLVGALLFFIKHEVMDLESQLATVHHDIQRNQEDIHVLKAEWSYLNDPVRLRQLAEKHLGMKLMGPAQIATLNTLNQAPSTALVQATATSIVPGLPKPQAAAPGAVAVAAAHPAAPKHVGTGLAMAAPATGGAR